MQFATEMTVYQPWIWMLAIIGSIVWEVIVGIANVYRNGEHGTSTPVFIAAAWLPFVGLAVYFGYRWTFASVVVLVIAGIAVVCFGLLLLGGWLERRFG
ncbi:hypothetical protein KA529_02255 [Candidatus Saccharibacteria bacterium]|nr:hypothetical protein [Candidatus Saccharibacteria bacterium]